MIHVVVGYEDLRITEVVGRIAKVGAVECPQFILGPILKVGRCSAHHHLTVLAVAIMTCIINIICTIFLIGTARAERSILLKVVTAIRQQFAERLVAGTVLSCDSPNGMETEGHVIDVLLEVKHFECAILLIVVRHGVSNASYIRHIIRAEIRCICRSEEGGSAVPVLRGISAELFVAACRQRRGRQHECEY